MSVRIAILATCTYLTIGIFGCEKKKDKETVFVEVPQDQDCDPTDENCAMPENNGDLPDKSPEISGLLPNETLTSSRQVNVVGDGVSGYKYEIISQSIASACNLSAKNVMSVSTPIFIQVVTPGNYLLCVEFQMTDGQTDLRQIPFRFETAAPTGLGIGETNDNDSGLLVTLNPNEVVIGARPIQVAGANLLGYRYSIVPDTSASIPTNTSVPQTDSCQTITDTVQTASVIPMETPILFSNLQPGNYILCVTGFAQSFTENATPTGSLSIPFTFVVGNSVSADGDFQDVSVQDGSTYVAIPVGPIGPIDLPELSLRVIGTNPATNSSTLLVEGQMHSFRYAVQSASGACAFSENAFSTPMTEGTTIRFTHTSLSGTSNTLCVLALNDRNQVIATLSWTPRQTDLESLLSIASAQDILPNTAISAPTTSLEFAISGHENVRLIRYSLVPGSTDCSLATYPTGWLVKTIMAANIRISAESIQSAGSYKLCVEGANSLGESIASGEFRFSISANAEAPSLSITSSILEARETIASPSEPVLFTVSGQNVARFRYKLMNSEIEDCSSITYEAFYIVLNGPRAVHISPSALVESGSYTLCVQGAESDNTTTTHAAFYFQIENESETSANLRITSTSVARSGTIGAIPESGLAFSLQGGGIQEHRSAVRSGISCSGVEYPDAWWQDNEEETPQLLLYSEHIAVAGHYIVCVEVRTQAGLTELSFPFRYSPPSTSGQ